MSADYEREIEQLAQRWDESKRVVVLTGAGASTEAGLPDWRGPAGMWKQWSPTRLASLSALRDHPVEFYEFYRYRLSKLHGVGPGPTQKALAALEQAGKVRCIITQNIDGLHQAAGSENVIEMHGNLGEAQCVDCDAKYAVDRLDVEVTHTDHIPRCDACQGMLKPGIVLFEEALPADALTLAFDEAQQADLFIVVGSSLEVGPVNLLPVRTVEEGGRLAIINMDDTHLDSLAHWVIRDRAGEVLAAVAQRLGVAVPDATNNEQSR